jgi:nucleotide-binding universal stress UspA family protein
MAPIRTILHPTDFSTRAEAALDTALSLARDHGARLIILHIEPPDSLAEGTFDTPRDPRAVQRAIDQIRARVEGTGSTAPLEILVHEGDPLEEILRTADERHCDMIVLGTHGRTGLGRLMMGSMAEEVVRRARCPVLTVKAAQPAQMVGAGAS